MVSYSFAQAQEEVGEAYEKQTEEQDANDQGENVDPEQGEGADPGEEITTWEEGEYDWGEDTLRVLTPKEIEKMIKKTEKLARQLVDEKFKQIDKQRKMEYKEEKRQKKLEKQKKRRVAENRGRTRDRGRGRVADADDDDDKPKKETKEEQKLQEKQEKKPVGRRSLFDDDDDEEYEETEEEIFEYYYESGIDTALLRQRMAEMEVEMWNVRNIDDAKKGRKGTLLLKLKIPDCYYLNSVIYQRGDFEFIYQLDFFIHYFHNRYHHRRKFYDRGDTTRVIARQIMNFAGNTKYRKTNLNMIIDSIGSLSGNPIAEYIDGVISELNLEYLATGDIKLNYKGKNQKKIYAVVKPSDIELRSLGHIAFYTWDKKKIIEQIDASLLNAYLPLPEKDYMDSILMVRIPLPPFGEEPIPIAMDSLSSTGIPINSNMQIKSDTISLGNMPIIPIMPMPVTRDSLSSPVIPINSNLKITPDTISLENAPMQNAVPVSADREKVAEETKENNIQEKAEEAVVQPPVEEEPVLPENTEKKTTGNSEEDQKKVPEENFPDNEEKPPADENSE